ncbi:hypothetical protein LEMLEM_LOCUS24337 [Lemmus lemmus]
MHMLSVGTLRGEGSQILWVGLELQGVVSHLFQVIEIRLGYSEPMSHLSSPRYNCVCGHWHLQVQDRAMEKKDTQDGPLQLSQAPASTLEPSKLYGTSGPLRL